ncbi:carbohydrate kinase family protein [Streptomyces sp. NPDC001922]|uniref:carbohydrate kinase family protein n=1 Tax=Streptomyces sp. NPDC001922 TaxID=3364624 RepID=UPI00367D5865
MTGSGDADGRQGPVRGGLLVIGDVITDVVARHSAPLAPATDTTARVSTLPGGAGANAACWAARSGAPDVRLMGCVGADSAAWHEDALLRCGVRPALRVDPDAATGTVICLVDATAERTLVTDSGAALRLSPADWRDGLLDGVARLHLSGYLFFAEGSRALARVAMAAARDRSVPVSVDPASAGFIEQHGPAAFLASVAAADLLLPNSDEATLLTGLADPADAAAELSRDFGLVAVKRGAAGAVLAAGGDILARVPAPAVTPVDTTGAGDAFTGAFLAALLAGGDPVTAAEAGCRAGAEAVTRAGGRPPERGASAPADVLRSGAPT